MTVTITMPSGRTERCSKPGSCRRHSPHASTAQPVASAVDKNDLLKDVKKVTAKKSAPKVQPTPIHVKAIVLQSPNEYMINSHMMAEENNPYFDLEIDYTEGGYYGENPTRINKVVLKGVKDLKGLLARTFNTFPHEIPDELVKYAQDNGLDKPEAYTTEIHDAWDGYYGEEDPDQYSVSPKSETMAKLYSWYYNQPNAIDHHRLLAYARGKGIDTTGLTPEEAIKKQLIAEHPELAKKLEKANSVSVRKIKRGDVTYVDEKRLTNASRLASWAAPEANKKGDEKGYTYDGVLYATYGKDARGRFGTKYRLLDGFSRYKSNTAKGKMQNYIVISN